MPQKVAMPRVMCVIVGAVGYFTAEIQQFPIAEWVFRCVVRAELSPTSHVLMEIKLFELVLVVVLHAEVIMNNMAEIFEQL